MEPVCQSERGSSLPKIAAIAARAHPRSRARQWRADLRLRLPSAQELTYREIGSQTCAVTCAQEIV